MSNFEVYRKKKLAQERLQKHRKKTRLENQKIIETTFSDDDVNEDDFNELYTSEPNVFEYSDVTENLRVLDKEVGVETDQLNRELVPEKIFFDDYQQLSTNNEKDNVIIEDNDYEDELQPASVTEDDVDELTDDFFSENLEIDELREWAIDSKLPQMVLDKLLLILRKRLLPELPKTAKTFLRTASEKYDIEVNETDYSEFIYFGIAEPLKKTVNASFHIDNTIHLLVNVDGLQLFKSSSQQFWPILCQVFSEENIYKPFPVAIYADGLLIDDKTFDICIKSFICDRPARALLKSIKGHGGYWACERCDVRGERIERRVVYPVNDSARKRTDESFRQQANAGHHIGQSPLLDIHPPIDMISSFVLDFMHLICLGVMKKLLFYWLNTSSKNRLGHTGKILLSDSLLQIQKQIPCEFQRTTRSLVEVERFKAIEFKFILLYAGPIILKNVLSDDMYKHFLLLHTACRILCSKTRAVIDCHHARSLLNKFVMLMPRIYGDTSLIGNVHNLSHLADDVEVMGCSISCFTAFPFENALGQMKKWLRSGNRPLAQICRRLQESFSTNYQKVTFNLNMQILTKLNPDETGKIQIKRLKYKGITLTTKSPNNSVMLTNGSLIQITSMFTLSECTDVQIEGNKLKKKKSLFLFPCDSEHLHMWNVVNEPDSLVTYNLSEVVQKMLIFTFKHDENCKIYAMPLLHM